MAGLDVAVQVTMILAFCGNALAVVWGASKLVAIQQSHTEIIKELRTDIKSHIDDDREFQLKVTERLSSIQPTIGVNGRGRPHD